MEDINHPTKAKSPSGSMDWSLMVDMEMEALSRQHRESSATGLHDGDSSSKVGNRDLPTQPEAETPHKERVQDVDLELPYEVPNSPAHGRGPPQNNWRGQPSLHQRLQTAQHCLHQEKEMRLMAEHNAAIVRCRLEESEKKLKEQDKEMQILKETVKSLSYRTPNTEPLDRSSYKNKEALIRDLKDQAQDERQRADFHKQEVEEVKLQFNERVTKDLTLIKRLTVQKDVLKQEMESMKVLQKETCRLSAEQLEVLQRQLEEKTSSGLELASRLKIQEEACQALEKKVETFKVQMKLQVCEMIAKTSSPKETSKIIPEVIPVVTAEAIPGVTREVITEVTPEVTTEAIPEVTTEVITEVATPEKVPETEEKPSKWRRFKKFMTPKHRRKYKNKKQDGKQEQE